MELELGDRLGPPPFPSDTDTTYRAVHVGVGPEAAVEPAFGWAGYFDGLSQAQMVAHDRAGRDRIEPVADQLPGLVAVYSLRTLTNEGALELVFSTSIEAIEAGNRTINTMDLLPDKDPALLVGPSRAEVYRVGRFVQPLDRRAEVTGPVSAPIGEPTEVVS